MSAYEDLQKGLSILIDLVDKEASKDFTIEDDGLSISTKHIDLGQVVGPELPKYPEISPHELREGQLVCMWGHDDETYHLITEMGIVSKVDAESVFIEGGGMWFNVFEDHEDDRVTILLLEDAPEEEEPRQRRTDFPVAYDYVVRPDGSYLRTQGHTPNRVNFQDGPAFRVDAHGKSVGTSNPTVKDSGEKFLHHWGIGLTVHSLDTAPDRSVVRSHSERALFEKASGRWYESDTYEPASVRKILNTGGYLFHPKAGR